SPKSPKTGPASPWTATRRYSILSAPPPPRPAFPSPPIWTDDATKLRQSLHPNNFACYDSALTIFSPSGTIRLNPVCDFIFASALSSLVHSKERHYNLSRNFNQIGHPGPTPIGVIS